ncbi:MAG: S-layer homology domain-containing protein [Treponema sp.]|nr:S-layer homology domain-containing protein [Treponema sp.]
MKFSKSLISALLLGFLVLSCSHSIHVGDPVPVTRAFFPDATFRDYVSREFDKDHDGYLSADEIYLIRNVHCENMGVKSVKGIEFFPYLEGLWCLNNHISSWNLEGNPHLKGIWCSHNDFTYLDFSDCPELEWVYCFNCDLRSLNVRDNPELAYLECNANPNLKNLDLSHNPKLENLFCSNCGLTSLDLSNNPMMCELAAFKNDLHSIDLSNNTKMKRLDIWDNPNLGDVDISMLDGLQYYNCAKNGVTHLDMSGKGELLELVCSYNENLTYLDVSECPKLAFLNLECDWRLPSLDISNNPKLYHLYAFGLNSISTLDISHNPHLIATKGDRIPKWESHLGNVYSYTLDFGGSGDPFDELRHELVVNNGLEPTYEPEIPTTEHDSFIDENDKYGPSSTAEFATRGQAIQALYDKAGKPSVSGTSRFTDISSSEYADAIKWGEQNKICFGYPDICSDTFCPDDLISREDFALMAHRFAGYMHFGTAFDYGRTDWYLDYYDIDFYAWGPFTWAMQFQVLLDSNNSPENADKTNAYCYPHGRMTSDDLSRGVDKIFHLSEAASYSAEVNGNGD